MPRLPRVTGAEALRKLQRDGWQVHRITGSHHHLTHATKTGVVTLPVHAGQILKPKTLLNVLADAGLSVDQFRAL